MIRRQPNFWQLPHLSESSSAISTNSPDSIFATNLGGIGGSPAPIVMQASIMIPDELSMFEAVSPSCLAYCSELAWGREPSTEERK